jgi:hypothetical protein
LRHALAEQVAATMSNHKQLVTNVSRCFIFTLSLTKPD